MQLSNIPIKFLKAFGVSASPSNIRTIPVTTADPDAASQTLGWPPSTMTPSGAGGVPPDGRDMNGLGNMLSAWAQWQAAGGVVQYDSAFQAAIGGYPRWSIVGSLTNPGTYWQNQADNNTSNPDAAGANWITWPSVGVIPWSAPPPIGTVTPNSGRFSDLIGYSYVLSNGPVGGTDLTINGVGFTTSLGISGYQKLPTGLIMQWGRLNLSSGVNEFVPFPVSFPNTCSIAMDVGNDGSGVPFIVNGSLVSGPPFTGINVWAFRNGVATAPGISYVAFGS